MGGAAPLLPLDASKVTGIAVVGPNGIATDACNPYSGDYCICDGCATSNTVSIVDGLREYLLAENPSALVNYSAGCGLTGGKATDPGFAAAEVQIRSDSISHIVVAVGLSGVLEGEGSDRVPSHGLGPGLGLPGMQQQLVELAASVGKPVILVVVAGGAVPIPANANITAEFVAVSPQAGPHRAL